MDRSNAKDSSRDGMIPSVRLDRSCAILRGPVLVCESVQGMRMVVIFYEPNLHRNTSFPTFAWTSLTSKVPTLLTKAASYRFVSSVKSVAGKDLIAGDV